MVKVVVLVFWVLSLAFLILLAFKSENAYENHKKIIDALDAYANDAGNFADVLLMLDNMESYDKTIYRLWDWGYENILPQEDFELIKPYIK